MKINRKVLALIVAIILFACFIIRLYYAYLKGFDYLIDTIITAGILLATPIFFYLISNERFFHSKKKLKITNGKKCLELNGYDVDRIKIDGNLIDVKAKRGGTK